MAANHDRAEQLTRAIATEFRRRMLDEYVPRIAGCVAQLSEAQIWEQLGPQSNSVGVLLLHLEGNVRQWILCGVGGQPDTRDRDGEFAATSASADVSAADLAARLEATVTEAVAIVDRLGPDDLLARRQYQGRYEETGVGAVLHVMEHFSGHAGQIYAHTKQVLGVDLRHYDL